MGPKSTSYSTSSPAAWVASYQRRRAIWSGLKPTLGGPVAPDGPVGPVGPVAPVGPTGPDGPVGPVGPSSTRAICRRGGWLVFRFSLLSKRATSPEPFGMRATPLFALPLSQSCTRAVRSTVTNSLRLGTATPATSTPPRVGAVASVRVASVHGPVTGLTSHHPP